MSYVLNNYTDTYMGSIILEEAMNTSIINIIEESNKIEDMIISQDKGPNRLIADVVLQDADRENRNKRWYALVDLRKEIYGDRISELVKTRSFKGEAGHPLSDSVVRQQTIDPKLVCVNHIKVWIDKDLVRAHSKGTNNDYGKEFDDDLRSGEYPAFSLRTLGIIENINGKAYVKHLRIITYDRVYYPSHSRAYTYKILESSLYNQNNFKNKPINYKLLKEQAIADGIEEKNIDYNKRIKQIEEMNESGKIITITGSDAINTLNQLQKESASIGRILETFEGIADDIKLLENGSKLRLTTRYGETMYLNLNEHTQNLISNYAYEHLYDKK